jgi:hypothetical protein
MPWYGDSLGCRKSLRIFQSPKHGRVLLAAPSKFAFRNPTLRNEIFAKRVRRGCSSAGRQFFAPAIRTPRSIATINAARGAEVSASRASIASRHRAASGCRAWPARLRSLGWVDHANWSTLGAAALHRQGKSGLRLSAQRKAVQVFADAEAFQIVSEYLFGGLPVANGRPCDGQA